MIDHISGAVKVRFHRKTLGRIPDSSIINQNLSVGGVSKIEYLAREGVKAIVDVRAEASDEPSDLKKFEMDYIRLEVYDRGVPTFDKAISTTTWIKNHIKNGNKVFVHCNLGRGRGPLVTVLYLISEGMKTDEAIETVKNARPYCYFNTKQLDMINEFSKKV